MSDAEKQSGFYKVLTGDERRLFSYSAVTRGDQRDQGNERNQSHLEPSLSLMQEGTGKLVIGTREMQLREGDLFILRSMEPHHIFADKAGTQIRFITIGFSAIPVYPPTSEWVDKRLSVLFFSTDSDFNNLLPRNHPRSEELRRLFRELGEELAGEQPNQFALKGKFLTLISRLPEMVDIDSLTDYGASAKYTTVIASSIAYINRYLTEDISLKQLAQQAGMEVSRFSEVFKAIQGISPWKYVLNTRVRLAKNYLRENQCYYTISEIAAMTGFGNLSNFNKVFKSVTGVTPSEYRRNAK